MNLGILTYGGPFGNLKILWRLLKFAKSRGLKHNFTVVRNQIVILRRLWIYDREWCIHLRYIFSAAMEVCIAFAYHAFGIVHSTTTWYMLCMSMFSFMFLPARPATGKWGLIGNCTWISRWVYSSFRHIGCVSKLLLRFMMCWTCLWKWTNLRIGLMNKMVMWFL